MEPKVKALISELQKVFENGRIEYRFENELHKFRLEDKGPSQWLYVSRNFVDDHTDSELLKSFSRLNVIGALSNSTRNRWLFLNEEGVKEVDDSFGRGH